MATVCGAAGGNPDALACVGGGAAARGADNDIASIIETSGAAPGMVGAALLKRDTSTPDLFAAARRCMDAGISALQPKSAMMAEEAAKRVAYTASAVSIDRLHAHMGALELPGAYCAL